MSKTYYFGMAAAALLPLIGALLSQNHSLYMFALIGLTPLYFEIITDKTVWKALGLKHPKLAEVDPRITNRFIKIMWNVITLIGVYALGESTISLMAAELFQDTHFNQHISEASELLILGVLLTSLSFISSLFFKVEHPVGKAYGAITIMTLILFAIGLTLNSDHHWLESDSSLWIAIILSFVASVSLYCVVNKLTSFNRKDKRQTMPSLTAEVVSHSFSTSAAIFLVGISLMNSAFQKIEQSRQFAYGQGANSYVTQYDLLTLKPHKLATLETAREIIHSNITNNIQIDFMYARDGFIVNASQYFNSAYVFDRRDLKTHFARYNDVLNGIEARIQYLEKIDYPHLHEDAEAKPMATEISKLNKRMSAALTHWEQNMEINKEGLEMLLQGQYDQFAKFYLELRDHKPSKNQKGRIDHVMLRAALVNLITSKAIDVEALFANEQIYQSEIKLLVEESRAKEGLDTQEYRNAIAKINFI